MSQFNVLQELGLSKTGVQCYVCLFKNGPAPSRRLSEQLKIPQTNLYGILNKLEEQGFVSRFKITTQPTLFKALPLDQALKERYMRHRKLLMPLCRELNVPSPPTLPPGQYVA